MLSELKLCPFCGAQPEQSDVSEYYVECPSCGLQGPYGELDTQESSVESWNRREVEQAAITEQAAPAGEAIGEMRENGVTWFKGNPHSFPVGTRFYTGPQPSECKRCSELTTVAHMYPDDDVRLHGNVFVGGDKPGDIPLVRRADAEAKIDELTAERDRLILAVADHVTAREGLSRSRQEVEDDLGARNTLLEADKARARAVIVKCKTALLIEAAIYRQNDPEDGEPESMSEALAAIADYQKGVES